jgi:hypothetical protein
MNILNYKHSILILHELLYCNSSIEFISEFIKKNKNLEIELTSLELKERVKNYLFFLMNNEFIYLKCGDFVYNKNNIEAFLEILDNNWDKFENTDNVDYDEFWYSYLIEYSERWNNALQKLKQNKL